MEKMNQRTEMVIGKTALEKLSKCRVLILGIGGVGSSVLDSLARSGIKNFGLVDRDSYNETNFNRQIFSNMNTINKPKVEVAKNHLSSISSGFNVDTFNININGDTISMIDFSKYDYVVDCIDVISAKILVIKTCVDLNIPIISSLGTGNKLNPTNVMLTDISKTINDPFSKAVRKQLKDLGIKHLNVCYSNEFGSKNTLNIDGRNIPGSTYFVPNVAGIYIGYKVLTDLLEK